MPLDQNNPSLEALPGQDRSVHLVSLGCARNRVDAEVMLGGLVARGWVIATEPEFADAIVVNTCGFIGPAKEESIDSILKMAAHKKAKPEQKLVVTGCLTQRYKTQLAKGLPEVDFFIGTDEFTRLPELLDGPPVERGSMFARRTNYLYDAELPKLNTLSKRSAYVKVAEGCQHNCAFCIIPAIRGRLRSRPIQGVLSEAQTLATQGVYEINLIAQDLAAYGRDFRPDSRADLLDLLKALVKVEDLKWIRLLYMYPENISDAFLDLFGAEDKLVKYLDVPMQHGDDDILKRMNRGVTRKDLADVVYRLREKIPDMVIRTTVMVGFPGETEAQFLNLLDFVREMEFDHLGAFSYSQEEGTVAGRMADQIPEAVKAERLRRVMALQQDISKKRLKRFIGQSAEVLMESIAPDGIDALGRMAWQAPEVDGFVRVKDAAHLLGEIAPVKITASLEYDLVGVLEKSPVVKANTLATHLESVSKAKHVPSTSHSH